MADRFDKFTERARRVLTLAQEEAQRFNHNYIGTEHLLLGLVREGDGVAAKVLNNLGVELSKVRSAVEFIIGRGEKSISGEIGLTPRAKKVIELAVEEARRLNHSYIGTEHLLLGLVREGEGIAFGVLESLGVSLERVRTETTKILSQSTPQSAPAGGTLRRALGKNLGCFSPNALEANAQGLEDTKGDTFTLANEAKEQMLRADVAVVEAARLFNGELDDFLCTRRQADFAAYRLFTAADDELDSRADLAELHAEVVENLGCHTVALANEAEEKMFGADIV